jgi:hypothetical protein
MPITCKICGKSFEKLISNSHLKTHNMTTTQYKNQYGTDSLSSPEYRKQLSASRTGENNPNYQNHWSVEQRTTQSKKMQDKVPWNKGKKVSTTDSMRVAVELREQKYRTGELKRKIRTFSQDQRQHLSLQQKNYAANNPQKMSERAYKAVNTKINSGQDLGKNMRGKHHSANIKQKIKISVTISNLKKSQRSLEKIQSAIKQSDLTLVNLDGVMLNLQCNSCKTEFSLTRQCFTPSKFRDDRCPVCHPKITSYRSQGETQLYEYVKSICGDAVPNVRNIVGRSEIDIWIPSKQIAIEYNGLYWHSESVLESVGKSKYSDNEKRKKLNDRGIRYISVFEDEWVLKPEIVKSRISNILSSTDQRIFARKCVVKSIDSKTASEFCRINHIQGAGRSNVRYGLFYQDQLVSVMTFSKNNISRKITAWEINRFCSCLGYTVVGGASRLFKQFIQDYKPDQVISYADNRWSTGNLYKQLGFQFDKQTAPNYWYVPAGSVKRIHRFALRKPQNQNHLTEKQLRDSQGYMRVWDCGSTKWIWTAE